MYSTDNGPHMNSWPDAGMTPFRNEKNSNWEGAYRVPAVVRWPGQDPGGHGPQRHREPQRLVRDAARRRRRPDIADQLKAGADLNGTTYKVHLDGHNQLPYLTGEADESPRKHFFYVSDDGDLTAMRFDNWKLVFLEQRAHGHAAGLGRAVHRAAGARRSSTCAPTPTSGPTSPRTPTTTGCSTTRGCCVPAQAYVAEMLHDAGRVPAAQKPASFSLDQVHGEARGRRRERMTAGAPSVPAPTLAAWIPAARSPWARTSTTPRRRPPIASTVDGFWIDAVRGDQRRLRRVRRGDGLRHGGRAPARPGRLPRRAAGEPGPGLAGVHADPGPVDLRHLSQWWTWVPGASWRHPEGPGSDDRRTRRPPGGARRPRGRGGLRDLGRRGAADRGRVGARRPRRARRRRVHLGRRGAPGRRDLANTWDGDDFPWRSTGESGFDGTSPVGSVPAQRLRALRHGRQRVGVDRRLVRPPRRRVETAAAAARRTRAAATMEDSYDPAQPQFRVPRKVIKGGSHLCADTYCLRYRPAARRPQMIDTGMSHIGFRCVPPTSRRTDDDRPRPPAVLAPRAHPRRRSPRSSTHPRRCPVERRVAAFDNDGTLWCERPTYAQLDFFVDALQAAAAAGPRHRGTRPSTPPLLDGDQAAMGELGLARIADGAGRAVRGPGRPRSSLRGCAGFMGRAAHRTLGRPVAPRRSTSRCSSCSPSSAGGSSRSSS